MEQNEIENGLQQRVVVKANAELIPVIKQTLERGKNVTFSVKGTSMRPFLEGGRDKAILAPVTSADEIRPGDVILAEVGQQVYAMHRVVSLSSGEITMRGDGNVYAYETFTPDKIVGRAIGFVRGRREKLTRISDLRWRLFSQLWPANNLLRRLGLALHARIVLPLSRCL